MDRRPEGAVGASPAWAGGRPGVVLEKVTEELQVKGHSRCYNNQHILGDPWWPPVVLQGGGASEVAEQRLTLLWLAVDGLRTVSSGLLGLGLGDSQELKKDWMKGSRFCPLWRPRDREVSGSGAAQGSWWTPGAGPHGPRGRGLTSLISFPGTDLKIFPVEQQKTTEHL